MAYQGIPAGPLAAYLNVRNANQEAGIGELQQVGAVQGLLAKMQAQQQEQRFQSELQALGPNPTPEQIAPLAMRYRKPELAVSMLQAAEQRKSRELMGQEVRQSREETARLGRESREDIASRERLMRRDFAGQMEQYRRDALAARPAPAPSTTEIVDPTDSRRMLKIDTRLYRGGTLGSAGVIGLAGKEPGYAKREEKEAQGIEHLKSEIDNLRGYYNILKEAKAIPSSEESSISNIWAFAKGSTPGQLGGRMLGTKEQDARNAIQSSRMRLLNAIKNATGMSAQQLNSNIELQTWLQSLTDVNRSYESNIEILDKIEKGFAAQKQKPSDSGWKDL